MCSHSSVAASPFTGHSGLQVNSGAAAASVPAVQWRKLILKANLESGTPYFSLKSLVTGAFNVGLIGSACTALPRCRSLPTPAPTRCWRQRQRRTARHCGSTRTRRRRRRHRSGAYTRSHFSSLERSVHRITQLNS